MIVSFVAPSVTLDTESSWIGRTTVTMVPFAESAMIRIVLPFRIRNARTPFRMATERATARYDSTCALADCMEEARRVCFRRGNAIAVMMMAMTTTVMISIRVTPLRLRSIAPPGMSDGNVRGGLDQKDRSAHGRYCTGSIDAWR